WTKNLIIFPPLLFSLNLIPIPFIIKSSMAFAVFCVLSGCVYLLNDMIDLEQDKRHPVKSRRPLASGALKPAFARTALVALLVLSLTCSFAFLNTSFIIIAVIYVLLQIAYSTYLKHVVIIDVFCIATGFLLRVAAGAEVIQVSFSTWLLFCTILLSLFLALSKRRHELLLLEGDAIHHRKILFEYSPELLDQMISIVTTATVIVYILYTISEDTVKKFGSDNLKYTTPFVLYGIFRYLYLIHQRNEGGSPEKVLLNDRPLLYAVLLYGVTACFVLYF
ncbi:MAG: decaprenyl-phosphate phosphoribosyltransferase, partial [Pseudomonadota bacterium]